ncbi:tail fiber assembly protein [Morganella morganii]|uniref:tail fiber assembly protein n=1 Tax=Morganella morganii TaxID=582 RepID=UPI003EB7AFF3
MNYLYSPKTNSFYATSLSDEYDSAGTLPDDAFTVEDSIYTEYSRKSPAGKIRVADKNGLPAWGDTPPLTDEEQIAEAEAKKQMLITEVNTETEMLRAKLALGRIREGEKAQLNVWLDYLDLLEAVDTSPAPDIDWPQKPQ